MKLYAIKTSIDVKLVGVNLKYDATELRPYGESLIWPVIPPEHFYTIEDAPQIIIDVDDYPALCRSLNCKYTYTD